MNIEDVEGIGPVNAGELREAGVSTTDDLLQRGGSQGGRADLETATGISGSQLLEWTNHVDLYRISGSARSTPICWRPPESTLSLSWPSGMPGI
jgi:hypothetical protein